MSMSPQQCATAAQWIRELGLLTVASLVVQKVVSGAPLTDPVVMTGAVAGGVLYLLAARLLLRS